MEPTTSLRLRVVAATAALFLVAASSLVAQVDTFDLKDTHGEARSPSDLELKPRPWYDTLTVTTPKYARKTQGEYLALAAFVVASIPTGAAILVVTGLPPSVVVINEGGVARTGLAISSGYGFTHDTSSTLFFPKGRIMVEGAWIFDRERNFILRSALLADLPITPIDKRNFYWLGLSGGGGLSTDFGDGGPFAEGSIGLIVPMGIRYIGLFPMHNYGVRGRVGYSIGEKSTWYEISLSMTSTFW